MKPEDLISEYEKIKKEKGPEAFKYFSRMLRELKKEHKEYFSTSPTARRAEAAGRVPDHEQSWRAYKGKNLEHLIMHIIIDQISELGLHVINGNRLEKKQLLSEELSKVKRNLLVDYGEYGSHLPDVDLVIYNPSTFEVLAVVSSKVTLRERIAQTGYWKLKLGSDSVTKNIKVYFLTLDEDGSLTKKQPLKKGRAIVETDLDGCYVLSEAVIEQSEKVKTFDKFIEDIAKIKTESSKLPIR